MIHKPPLVKRSDAETAAVLKALGEPRRLEILRLLQKGPKAVVELTAAVDVSQQAVSQHLAVLDKVGLVECRKEGTRSVYAVKPSGFVPVQEFVRGFWEPRLLALKAEIEKKR